MPEIAAILLAAGAARRMRGRDKLLEQIEGVPLLRRSALRILDSKINELIVVFGAHREAREAIVSDLSYRGVFNTRWDDGMGGSISEGVQALGADIDAALICLADMPLVDAALIDRLIAAFETRAAHETIIAPQSEAGAYGNPALFDRCHFDELAALGSDSGGRAILKKAGNAVRSVPAPQEVIRCDLDTPESWTKFRNTFEN